MFGINRWDYVAPITRKSDAWLVEDELVRGKWVIERWYDDEFEEWCQTHTGKYIDEDGREVETSVSLFPDDYSKREMLYYASVGEIDLPLEKYDEVTREEIIEIFEHQVENMSNFTLLKKWLRCQWNNFLFPFQMWSYDIEGWFERRFKAS